MESQSKILFAYPVVYKDNMTVEEMCTPAPFFTHFKPNEKQSIVITAGYTIDYEKSCFLLVNVDMVGYEKNYEDIVEDGRAETLRHGVFNGNMGVMATSFFMHDFLVKTTGFYEIEVKIHDVDEFGNKSDVVIDTHTSQFWVQVKEEL